MADFDPDAYLAKKASGFDPDAYLASKEPDWRGALGPLVEPPKPPPEPTVGQRLRAGLRGLVDTAKGAAATGYSDVVEPIARTVRHPIDTLGSPEGRAQLAQDFLLTNPAKRHQFERGLSDTVTFGLAERLANAVDPTFAARAPEEAVAAPNERAAGAVTGMFTPGATRAVARFPGGVVGETLGSVPVSGAVPGAVMGVAKGLASYELSAPAMAAGQAAVAGQNPIMAARQAATDPLGLLMSGGGGAIAGAAQGKAAKLRDTRTLEGRTVRDVEAANGQIKAFGQPTRGGLYEAPEMDALKAGRAGTNEMAGQTVERLVEQNNQKMAAARQAYETASDAILAEHADRHHLMSATEEALQRLEAENTVNGVAGNEGVARALDKVKRMITTETGQLDTAASRASMEQGGGGVYVTAPAVRVDDLIKIKKIVNRMGQAAADPDAWVYRELGQAIGDDAAAVDPRIGEMNAAYRAEIEPVKRANDILFGARKADVTPSSAQQVTAAGRLGRIGDETQAGTLREPQLEELRAMGPEYDRALKLMAAKKAMERLRYGEPETSTSIEKGMGRAVKHGVKKAVGATVGAALGHSLGPVGAAAGAVAGGAAAHLFENPIAMRLRVGLPIAETIGSFQPGSLAARFYLARQQQQAERHAAMGGP